MKHESDRIRADEQIRNRSCFILGSVGEFDIFVARAGEAVFADVHPSICDVINVREDGLIDHHLI